MKTNGVNTVTNINTACTIKVPHQAFGDLYPLLAQFKCQHFATVSSSWDK